jgi:hypothetical protein
MWPDPMIFDKYMLKAPMYRPPKTWRKFQDSEADRDGSNNVDEVRAQHASTMLLLLTATKTEASSRPRVLRKPVVLISRRAISVRKIHLVGSWKNLIGPVPASHDSACSTNCQGGAYIGRANDCKQLAASTQGSSNKASARRRHYR